MSEVFDVLILGGGPAGLAVASGIVRQLHTAVVFNNNKFRNAPASHMHNVPGWDHQDPSQFGAKAKADILQRYNTVQFRDAAVTSVRKLDERRFEATDATGAKYVGRKVVIASGVTDVFPQIPGYDELWGKAIFHCLFCHGYEERGASSAGVLATGLLSSPMFAPIIARMAGRLASVVNVYTDGDAAAGEQISGLLRSTKKFHFDHRKIAKLAKDPDVKGEAGVLVTFEDGSVAKEAFLAHVPNPELNGSFAKELGVEISPQGHINAMPPFFNTSVPGVFAAGDCATALKSVPTATMMGSCVAGGLAHALQAEDDVEE
ncbi:FAD/NAD(P)-binding domain-containing protein [Xylariaceae sp. FL0016]|nr:FAD/NAD(P)-binding domain-containing protein [Xylariaceae sp. FL0016]